MNLQERSDKRSLALHRAVVKRLRENPDLWAIPLQNIERWTGGNVDTNITYKVWKEILETRSHEDIIKLLLSRSQRATHLRSSSPFTGIISQEERKRIFERYNRAYRMAIMEDSEATKRELEVLREAVRDYLKHPS